MRKCLAIFIFFWSVCGAAQTLLISDIDDTIKVANVKDISEAAFWAFDNESRFTGMSDLYRLLAQEHADLKIVYLSKAPRWLLGSTHQKFLANGRFPAGQYIPRTEYSSETHKLRNIRKLMDSLRPRKVLLFGDNGEQDVEVYSQIVNEYAHQGIEFHQFIRIVYASGKHEEGVPLRDEQIGFVSPIEVSLELEKERLLGETSVRWMIENPGLYIINDRSPVAGDWAFPSFVNCADFQWKWDESLVRFELLPELKARLVARCKVHP